MDPTRPGQEVWQPHEEPAKYGNYGLEMRDALTGQPLWGVPGGGADVGRALAADVDPAYPGYECWGSVGGLYTNKGVQIGTAKPTVNFAVWWDGDLSRELLDAGYNSTTNVSTVRLEKWVPATNSLTRLLTPSTTTDGDAQTNNGTKANPCLTADILGDWREEILLRARDNQSLLLYSTTAPTTERIYTLMHDAQYRVAIAQQNSAYNQPPHPSFFLGNGMSAPPTPRIVLADSTNNTTLGARTSLDRASATVHPNPAAGTFHIQAQGDFSYQIYSLTGQMLEQGQGRNDFNGGHILRPGMYLVRVRLANGEQTTVKLQKE
jgi:rhamnogalacturonan endolyase